MNINDNELSSLECYKLLSDELSGLTVRMLDLWSRGRGFGSRPGLYHVVTSCMGDCLWTRKPSQYITKVNSAFHPSGIVKLNTGLSGWG